MFLGCSTLYISDWKKCNQIPIILPLKMKRSGADSLM